MRCPICKKIAAPAGNPYRPFCSERCKLIDLDNWLSGRYRIPAKAETDDRETSLVSEEGSRRDQKADLD